MLRWLRSIVAWRVVRDTGVWLYWQNDVTGQRKISRASRGGYQPVDDEWVVTGEGASPPPGPVDIGGPSVGVRPACAMCGALLFYRFTGKA